MPRIRSEDLITQHASLTVLVELIGQSCGRVGTRSIDIVQEDRFNSASLSLDENVETVFAPQIASLICRYLKFLSFGKRQVGRFCGEEFRDLGIRYEEVNLVAIPIRPTTCRILLAFNNFSGDPVNILQASHRHFAIDLPPETSRTLM